MKGSNQKKRQSQIELISDEPLATVVECNWRPVSIATDAYR